MTPEVVDSYGHSPYPYASDSLSSSRPASTESKATTNSACFFEVPHVKQNDDLMQTVCYIYEETKCAPIHYLFDIVTPPPSRVGTPVPERTATPFLDERGPKNQLVLLNRKSSLPSVKVHPAPWLRKLRRATIVVFSKHKVAELDRTTESTN